MRSRYWPANSFSVGHRGCISAIRSSGHVSQRTHFRCEKENVLRRTSIGQAIPESKPIKETHLKRPGHVPTTSLVAFRPSGILSDMCGIFGYVGPQDPVPIILGGLRSLEYRG